MTISEETLMAFADGELDAAARAAVELAMREDPEVAQRVARHRALRNRLQAAFADELTEPVPQRLLSVMRNPAAAKTSNVVDLQEVRAAVARPSPARVSRSDAGAQPASSQASWRQLGSIAAGVLLGVGIGYGLWQGRAPIGRDPSGALVAKGTLASALSSQLTAEQTGASVVHIGVSYLAKSGEYCRTFSLGGAATSSPTATAAAISGVACKEQRQWQIQVLAQAAPQSGRDYRTAATNISPLIMKSIEEQIQGEPLDASGEALARGHGWQSPK